MSLPTRSHACRWATWNPGHPRPQPTSNRRWPVVRGRTSPRVSACSTVVKAVDANFVPQDRTLDPPGDLPVRLGVLLSETVGRAPFGHASNHTDVIDHLRLPQPTSGVTGWRLLFVISGANPL